MRVALFFGLLAAVVLLAWWRGRTDERLAAMTCVGGTILTIATSSDFAVRLSSYDPGPFLVDVGVLLAFVAIALRSDRFWPLWVAGLQLTGTTVHLLKMLDPDLMRFVYRAALAFWSYPILFVIAAGAVRTRPIERWRALARLPEPS